MNISSNYIVVVKLEEEKKEGFQTVDIQDSSTFKGKVAIIPEVPVFVDNRRIGVGDTVLFAKYSPDTHDIQQMKFVKVTDLLAVL